MVKPKKILMLIDQFYPVVGGAEQQALRIGRELIAKGDTVSVLTRQSKAEYAASENYEGISIFRLKIKGNSGFSKIISIFPAIWWLISNQNKYDLIHCHGINPFEWSAWVARLITGKPYLVKIPLSNYKKRARQNNCFDLNSDKNNYIFDKLIMPILLTPYSITKNLFFKNANQVLAISPVIQQMLEGDDMKNVSLIPNGVDTEYFNPATADEKVNLRHHLDLEQNQIIFIYTGRLAAEKDIETLILAWQKFKAEFRKSKTRLLILGTGDGQKYSTDSGLKNIVMKQDIKDVVFTGKVNNVIEYLKAADCFILPSLWEGLSNALLEAMACGLPTIASDIPGNQAAIEKDKSGFLFTSEDYIELAKCMKIIAEDELLRKMMGERAKDISRERFDMKKVIDDIVKVYETILDG